MRIFLWDEYISSLLRKYLGVLGPILYIWSLNDRKKNCKQKLEQKYNSHLKNHLLSNNATHEHTRLR